VLKDPVEFGVLKRDSEYPRICMSFLLCLVSFDIECDEVKMG
jgi:hypothetical protein